MLPQKCRIGASSKHPQSTLNTAVVPGGMADILFPREAGRFISSRSKDVTISEKGITATAQKIYDEIQKNPLAVHADRWVLNELNPTTQDQAAIDWVFMIDTLNFSFWMEEGSKFKVIYKGKTWTGYWSLCAAVNRALDEGVPITDPKFYASITREQLFRILRSDSDHQMPMIEERLANLHQTGKTLVEKYDGSFVNVVKAADKSAQKLLTLIVQEFPSYRDVAVMDGQRVAIYKRVQIAIGDTWAACGGKGLAKFTDIDTITMFADYRIPQALAWFGVLEYSNDLRKLLDEKHMFTSGDRQEVEMRGCSIWAVELLVEAVQKLVSKGENLPKDLAINAITIDHFLWDFRRANDEETAAVPMHRIRCIYY